MNVLALILAGGTGTRLGVLTETLAKPSVYFGGKYRSSISLCQTAPLSTGRHSNSSTVQACGTD